MDIPEVFDDGEEKEKRKKIKIKLKDGKERQIQHMMTSSFWSKEGKPITEIEFMENLFGKMPELFQSEDELRRLWSLPDTRKALLGRLEEEGFSLDDLKVLQKMIDAEKSDLFDVLEYVFNSRQPITRQDRVKTAQDTIFANLDDKEREFIDFVLQKYIESGFEELGKEKLPILLRNKYLTLEDAMNALGDTNKISLLFSGFQKFLYRK